MPPRWRWFALFASLRGGGSAAHARSVHACSVMVCSARTSDLEVLRFGNSRSVRVRERAVAGFPPPVDPSEISIMRPGGSFRAHRRRRVRLHALATHVAAGWERYVLVEDVGIGGACIAVDEPLEPGDALNLSVTGPTLWDPLLLRGRVAWVETNASLRHREELVRSSSWRPVGRRAGLTLEHRSRDAVLAWYELITTL